MKIILYCVFKFPFFPTPYLNPTSSVSQFLSHTYRTHTWFCMFSCWTLRNKAIKEYCTLNVLVSLLSTAALKQVEILFKMWIFAFNLFNWHMHVFYCRKPVYRYRYFSFSNTHLTDPLKRIVLLWHRMSYIYYH